MSTAAAVDPRAHDEATAEKFIELAKAERAVLHNDHGLLRLAKGRYYRATSLATDMEVEEALALVAEGVKDLQRHEGNHFGSGMWASYSGLVEPYDKGRAERVLDGHSELREEVTRIKAEIDSLEGAYAGWSRFFLVVSSAGHIHSSRSCSSCRPTTRFGWLPQISGKDEAAAVRECGETLCSVCFPNAPTAWTQGKKLTKAQASKLVHGDVVV